VKPAPAGGSSVHDAAMQNILSLDLSAPLPHFFLVGEGVLA
jgi:hypothetical protein